MAELDPQFRDDLIVYPVLEALPDCLTAEFTKSHLEVPPFIYVSPGGNIALDHVGEEDGCAQMWVRLAGGPYPSRDFPNLDSTPRPSFSSMGFTIEVGVVRCIPGLSDDGEDITAEQYLEATRIALADMAAMRRAICNCLNQQERAYIFTPYSPYGPEGGVVGGWWQVQVQWVRGGSD